MKQKFVQFECPRCHRLYPEYVERLVKLSSGLTRTWVHPDRCEECGIGLQRRVRKQVD